MNTNAFQENKPEPVQFSNDKGWEYFEKMESKLLIKSNCVDYKTPTRKKATCL